jgi:hypothetical protein
MPFDFQEHKVKNYEWIHILLFLLQEQNTLHCALLHTFLVHSLKIKIKFFKIQKKKKIHHYDY